MQLIKTKQELRFYLNEDARVNGINGWGQYILELIYGSTRAQVVRYLRSLRKYEYYKNVESPLRFYYNLKNRRLGLRYGLMIYPNTVQYGLYIPHIEGGVIINCETMGYYCSANSGVIVGNKESQANRAVIGNNVKICVGAKIIGKVTIGDNSVIAPNAVVVKNVPSNTIVGGIPAKVLKAIK